MVWTPLKSNPRRRRNVQGQAGVIKVIICQLYPCLRATGQLFRKTMLNIDGTVVDENLFQRHKRTQCVKVKVKPNKRSERRLSKSEAESPNRVPEVKVEDVHWSEQRPSKCEASNIHIAWSKLRCLRLNLVRSMIFYVHLW